MVKTTSETLAHTIARVQAEAIAKHGWLVITSNAGHVHQIAGDHVVCHTDSVEFTDDDGVHAVLPYYEVRAIEVGRD